MKMDFSEIFICAKSVGEKVPLCIPFLFLASVAFIWYTLRSQQMLSFCTVTILNIEVDSPNNCLHNFLYCFKNQLNSDFYIILQGRRGWGVRGVS